MFPGIAKIILRAKIRQENERRDKKFLPWENINKIALILEKTDSLNKSAVDRFIEDTKKYIEVFYIEPGAKHPSYADWNCLTKKDRSFFRLPKKNIESELQAKKFDAVINTCPETNLFALSVCLSLQAYLKCGEDTMFNSADLIIKKTERFNLKNYLDETVKYLKMIRV